MCRITNMDVLCLLFGLIILILSFFYFPEDFVDISSFPVVMTAIKIANSYPQANITKHRMANNDIQSSILNSDLAVPSTSSILENIPNGHDVSFNGETATNNAQAATDIGLDTTDNLQDASDDEQDASDNEQIATNNGQTATNNAQAATDIGPDTTDNLQDASDDEQDATDNGHIATNNGQVSTDNGQNAIDNGQSDNPPPPSDTSSQIAFNEERRHRRMTSEGDSIILTEPTSAGMETDPAAPQPSNSTDIHFPQVLEIEEPVPNGLSCMAFTLEILDGCTLS